jgi:hypothetical protein
MRSAVGGSSAPNIFMSTLTAQASAAVARLSAPTPLRTSAARGLTTSSENRIADNPATSGAGDHPRLFLSARSRLMSFSILRICALARRSQKMPYILNGPLTRSMK